MRPLDAAHDAIALLIALGYNDGARESRNRVRMYDANIFATDAGRDDEERKIFPH